MAIIFATKKWSQYLQDRHFVIKTDQQSLKYLLENKLSTPFQQKWLSKLLGFDYEIQYKQGTTNKVADALSRVLGAELLHLAMSQVDSDLLYKITQSWHLDPTLSAVISGKTIDPNSHPKYQWEHGLLQRRGRLVVGENEEVKNTILKWHHTSSSSGHSGVQATLQKVATLFYWKHMKKFVLNYIRACEVCQKCKSDLAAYPGLLQPLPLPQGVWEDVAMDFIEGLPKSRGKDVILVVIDRFSKYGHFIPLSHPFTAADVAQAYVDNVYKLHGFPKSITSDRDKVFTSNFWREFLAIHGIDQNMSTAYHPQSDG